MDQPLISEANVAPLLSSLAEFTEQREQEALSTSLGRTIRDLTDANAVTLYRLLSTSGQEPSLVPAATWRKGTEGSIKENLPPPKPLRLMPMFSQCLSTLKITKYRDESENTVNLVLPLSGQKAQVDYFFLVECLCTNEIADRVLPLLLEIYRNFLDLLRDNQHDLLTGLLNRKTFDARIGNIMMKLNGPHHRKSDGATDHYCLAILDIDHFKRINDNFGHLYGDEVLLLISTMMQDSFREDDALFRFGGEEFVVLLRDDNLQNALRILERFRKKVEQREFPQVGHVTISGGVTLIQPNELPPQVIDRADRALYFAKDNGRNQICVYESLLESGLLAAPQVANGGIELF